MRHDIRVDGRKTAKQILAFDLVQEPAQHLGSCAASISAATLKPLRGLSVIIAEFQP